MTETLIVNLYGGPGVGKSTTAAMLFGFLKSRRHNVELVTEVAKDMTWEERKRAIRCQPYIFGKQLFRIERLRGKLEAVITDSPLLLAAVYASHEELGHALMPFRHFVLATWQGMRSIDFFLSRDHNVHPYVATGRTQTLQEAEAIDRAVLSMLQTWHIPHEVIPVREAEQTAEQLAIKVALELGHVD